MKMLTYHLAIFFFFVLFQITELTTGNVKAKMEVDSTCKYVFHWLDYKEKNILFLSCLSQSDNWITPQMF